jgi:hypothetical protein
MRTGLLLILLAGFILQSCEEEFPAPPSTIVKPPDVSQLNKVRGYTNWYINDFRCGVYVPADYDSTRKYPLIIFLHGHSDTITHSLPWYKEPFISKDPCIVLTPKCPVEETEGWGSTFYVAMSPMLDRAFYMVTLAEMAFNLDRSRYYIYGSSMGGYGTYAALSAYPDRFAAAYVECGSGSTDIAELLTRIPLWIFHGSADNTVPVQPARDLYQAVLVNNGQLIRYTEYPGVGHDVWNYTRNETTLKWWFLAQRKGKTHDRPEAVEAFTVELTEENQVKLQWNIPAEDWPPSDDNIWYCRIYRDGMVVKEVYNNQCSIIDSSITAGHAYEYRISAVNYFFRESELSAPVGVCVVK